jgi:dTDP-4-amino-4,6-dideoxygalactose transaminase
VVVTSTNTIPHNRPYLTGDELGYMESVLASGALDGDGPFTARASGLIREVTGASSALLTTSCTHALDMSAMLLELREGDEVILPSFTFPSTANAFALRGAVPVFVDCRPDTLNIDERLIEDAITERTRAVVVVHYAGVACELDAIVKIVSRYGLDLVEDNAHGFGGAYRARPLGSFGAMATQSFHATKNVQCGEGGALIINRPELAGPAEIIREKGTNRTDYYRGLVDKYHWVGLGSSYLPSELLAAFLTAQLEHFGAIQARRMEVWNAFHAGLAEWAAANGVGIPTVPEECSQPAHLYYLLLPDPERRRAFQQYLGERGVYAPFHYQPLHSAPAGVRHGRPAPGGCPVTERVSGQLVRLPLFAGLTDAEVEHIVDAITGYRVPAAA